MFVPGGLSVPLAILSILLVAVSVFSRKFTGVGWVPGNIRCQRGRACVYAPPASMLLLSPVLSSVMSLPGAILRAALNHQQV